MSALEKYIERDAMIVYNVDLEGQRRIIFRKWHLS